MSIGSPDPATVGPLSRKVLQYGELIERTVKQAKELDFTMADWDVLSDLVAVDEFERVGNYKEVMNWRQYAEMLTQWATKTEFWSKFRRISESGNLVFLELEEHNTTSGRETVVNSLSLYEFNAAGKLCHLDIYLQIAPE